MQDDTGIINSIVPNIYLDDLNKSKQFYVDFLGVELVMDMLWISTFASKENPAVQISVLQNNTGQKLNNEAIFLSIEASDIDRI